MLRHLNLALGDLQVDSMDGVCRHLAQVRPEFDLVLKPHLAGELRSSEPRLAVKIEVVLDIGIMVGVRKKHQLCTRRRLEVASTSLPNQSLEPMARSVTPRAAHVSRQLSPWLTI